MIGKKVIESKPVDLTQVDEILKERKKDVEELSYEQSLALKHAKKFVKITPAKARKLFEELSEVQGLTDESKVKLIDVMPKDMETLKLLVPKNAQLSDEKLTEILGIVKKFA